MEKRYSGGDEGKKPISLLGRVRKSRHFGVKGRRETESSCRNAHRSRGSEVLFL